MVFTATLVVIFLAFCTANDFALGAQKLSSRHFSRESRKYLKEYHSRSTHSSADKAQHVPSSGEMERQFLDKEAMHFIYAACGKDVKQDLLTSLTSLYLFASSSLIHRPSYYHFHVVSDGSVNEQDLEFLQPSGHFKASIHPPYHQAVEMFKPCSSERIYLHQHADFHALDKVIYVDTDTLWMDFPATLAEHFEEMDTKNANFGLAEETYDGGSWYTIEWIPPDKNMSIPFYGDRGLNAGLMMVSLAAVRASNFSVERDAIIDRYGPQGLLPMGDQDILNIYAHDYPLSIHVLPCSSNVRSDAICPEQLPILLHGNRGIMKNPTTAYNHLYTFFAMLNGFITLS